MNDKLTFLYYDKSTGVVEKIDTTKFLGLNFPDTPRVDLYLFAMSLGKNCGTKLTKKESFVRGEYVQRKPEAIPLITALSIGSDNIELNLDELVKTSSMYDLADECANTGFSMIEAMIDQESAENLELKLTAELDEVYKKNVLNKK